MSPEWTGLAKLLLIEDDAATAEEILADLRGAWARGRVGRHRAGRRGCDPFGHLERHHPRPDASGLDGLTLLRDLRATGDRTPALVLSALGDVDERIRGLRAGGDDYLGKPFVLGELAARIEALLRRPTDSRETVLRSGPWSSTSSPGPDAGACATSTSCRASSSCSNT